MLIARASEALNMHRINRCGAMGLFLASSIVAAASAACAQSGSAADPIVVHMKRGTYRIRLHGVLRQDADCCTYKFDANEGQHLTVIETGAAARLLLTYPDGQTDGPGLPQDLLLPAHGTYLLTISPNTMADGTFGKFTLTITIPPLDVKPSTSANGVK